MSDGVTPAQLSAMLADEIESVVDALGLKTKGRGGGVIRCFSPWTAKKTPKLEVRTNRKRGSWNDWEAGVSGDALGLVGCVLTAQPDMRTREARSEGVKWARARYGLVGGDFDKAAWARNVEAAKVRAAAKRKAEAEELKRHRGIAQAIWINADALRPTCRTPDGRVIPGCDGARYLEARGIDFDQLGRLPRAVRFSPAETWTDPEGERPDVVGPALVSAMTLVDGTFAAIHRIWIDPARPGEKADLSPPRKIWPSCEGAAIRLWRGASGLSIADAVKRGVEEDGVVAEGVEDGLSIAMMTPELRVDACGSLPGLLSYEPPACLTGLTVAADNDWDKPQAMALLKRALTRLAELLPTKIARSPVGKDFNDLLRSA